MTSAEFLRALENSLEIDSGKIKGDEILDQVGWWDSLGALTFMALADQELKVAIPGTQVQQCKSVPDLLALLGDKIVR